MEQEIKKAIIETLAYFDIFDFPLKQEEIWRWLFFKQETGKLRNKEIKGLMLKVLQNLILAGKIIKKDEFYFFPDRESVIFVRAQRRIISEQKIIKAKRLVKYWLKFIPWIKAVFLTNSASYYNADENSDIDLFIITKKNRLWISRFFSVLPLKILNLRPTKKNKKDKFCLSYFISEDNLNLEKYELAQNFPILVYWSIFYLPLYYKDNLWQKFWQENEWLKKYLPNYLLEDFGEIREIGRIGEIGGAKILDRLEQGLKKFQIWYLPQELKQAAIEQEENSIFLDDDIIKLHLGSKEKGKGIEEKWEERKHTNNNANKYE